MLKHTDLVTVEGEGQLRKAFETAQSFLVRQKPATAIKHGRLAKHFCIRLVVSTFQSFFRLLFASLISPREVGSMHTVAL